jgi:hypothetical protein
LNSLFQVFINLVFKKELYFDPFNILGSVLKDIHPGFVHYQVLPGPGASWGSMFRKMEIAKQKFNLEAYSVGQCTLEQIFLAFTKAQINVE